MAMRRNKGIRGEDDEFWHLRIRPQCDVCGVDFDLGEPIVGIEAADNPPFQVYGVFPFPDRGYDGFRLVPDWCLCRYPPCKRCCKDADNATIHADCFRLFMQQSTFPDKLLRLGTAAAWRQPWSAIETLGLSPRVDVSRGMRLAAEMCRLPILDSLPPEVAHMISNHSDRSLIWRYASVLELVDWLSVAEIDELVAVPICNIDAWHRGAWPTFVSAAVDKPVLRLTIDARGLSKIERLSERPVPSRWRSDAFAYIVEPAASFSQVTVDFKFGFAHLNVPTGLPGVSIWDRPCPPRLQDCALYRLPRTPLAPYFLRMKTINPQSCSGLTFFMSGGYTFDIHVHTPTSPTAIQTFARFTARQKDQMAWVYVPFSPPDQVTAFGVRFHEDSVGRRAYMLRLSLSGDVRLGPFHNQETLDYARNTGPGLAIVHGASESRERSFFIGVNSEGIDHATIAPDAPNLIAPFKRALLSSAPLVNATSIQIFEDPVTRFCKGIMIEYSTGAIRALGQCRLGMDDVLVYQNPSRICVAHVDHPFPGRSYDIREAKVNAAADPDHDHADKEVEWECFPMEGVLRFWFDNERAELDIMND